MSRGALAYFTSATMSTIDTIKSISNVYNLPFITWTNYARSYYSDKSTSQIVTKSKRSVFYESIKSRTKRGPDDDVNI